VDGSLQMMRGGRTDLEAQHLHYPCRGGDLAPWLERRRVESPRAVALQGRNLAKILRRAKIAASCSASCAQELAGGAEQALGFLERKENHEPSCAWSRTGPRPQNGAWMVSAFTGQKFAGKGMRRLLWHQSL